LISAGVPGEEVEGYLPWFQEETDTSSTEFVAIFNTKSHRKVFTIYPKCNFVFSSKVKAQPKSEKKPYIGNIWLYMYQLMV
jgi:hypothetical protein